MVVETTALPIEPSMADVPGTNSPVSQSHVWSCRSSLEATTAEVARRFGRHVAALVAGATDATAGEDRGPATSVARKARTVEDLRTKRRAARRLALGDKLHNARSLRTDHEQLGEALWSRFNAGRDEQLTYYRGLVEAFGRNGAEPQVGEVRRIVETLEREGQRGRA